MNWNTSDTNLIPKADAGTRIHQKAREEGIAGPFKVFYDGNRVDTPEDLPAMVDMGKVRVSAQLDQASGFLWS